MSNIDTIIQVASDLTNTVSTECQRIEDKLNELELFKAEMARREKEAWSPYWRLSRNQIGTVTDGMLDYFSKNSRFPITFEIYKTIKTDRLWEERDQEEQEILKAMAKEGIEHLQPEFNVIKMSWNSANVSGSSIDHTFFQVVYYTTWLTHACYAKLVSGEISGFYFDNITSEWGLCGTSHHTSKVGYIHPHPYISTESGIVLFCMLGTIAGRFPLDNSKPEWGYFPYVQRIED
ncbi:hypothetical protein L3V82_12570 [Thiotrichales bacterium 19S3-7]|nr:hypothetical protein [Thiotrichales bacterium 19S3-7]MCF6802778.1 hypothetical protein [Thiotrichales bacterium 19S3-11]